MMQIEVWNIQGKGFHFGRRGMGQENSRVTFPSDSLFAAMIARIAALEGSKAVDVFCQPFLSDDAPFALTSTYPRAGNVRFFPAPFLLGGGDLPLKVRYKDLKRLDFVSEGVFRLLLEGQSLADLYREDCLLQEGRALIMEDDIAALPGDFQKQGAQLWAFEKRPRVTIDRGRSSSEIFHTGRISYPTECGLWFGVRWLKPTPILREMTARLFVELGDSGLGAERSVGFGACEIKKNGSIELPDSKDQYWVSLSRYLPAQDEIAALQDEKAFYKIERVGGWITSLVRKGQRRREVQMLVEGSVLGPLSRPVPGRIADVRPCYPADRDPLGHPAYRSGLAVGVGIKGGS